MASFSLFWIIFNVLLLSINVNSISPVISSLTDARRVNVNFNVTNNQNYSSAPPNPDVTILSDDYFLCIWSYVVKEEDTKSNKTTYSNEIYSNLFSSTTGKSMVRSEYLLNKIKGYSQDTPSATTLFNTSNHLTRKVAVVWESQINDPTNSNSIIDAVFGRIITWSITFANGYRYVKVTSPTSQEFPISAPSIDYLHHQNPDVHPIYDVGMFLVSWTSQSDDKSKNMIFIRIYYNNGRPYSNQIQIDSADTLLWKKYPRSIPFSQNLTLLSWLSLDPLMDANNLMLYGLILDQSGNSTNYGGKHTLLTMDDAESSNHTIFENTIPCIAYLHNDKNTNQNFFILGWPSLNKNDGSPTMFAAVYAYDNVQNTISKISKDTNLFQSDLKPSESYQILHPQMENIQNLQIEVTYGLNSKIALCYTLSNVLTSSSNVFCKILEVSLNSDGREIYAHIEVVTSDKMINEENNENVKNEHPAISSESILKSDQVSYNENPQFVVVWSHSREGGYDVFTRILELDEDGNNENNNGGNGNGANQSIKHLTILIIGIVFGIICVVIWIFICIHLYRRRDGRNSQRKMHQLGDESDEEDEGGLEDTIDGMVITTGHYKTTMNAEEDETDLTELDDIDLE